MLDGVLQSQHTTLALSLVSHVTVLLVHTHHDAWHLWAADNGRENSAWCVISCEASLAHAAAVVNDKSCNLLVTHGC